ncbi:arylsulfatase [Arthrobacter sp. H14-L1]|uniref:arylsulfatase n=1 Tax=Arthrobacter sp. H14-L1 TaxID=2996697 RepID=UPI00226E4DF3|nr:arylsulfatase [Arthrobacter sp. H14-L1]MCY0904595.1 arylsulfatase [Arthrobacter sp. H14-L1]
MRRPNVVLICADEWRGDCLSGADHPYLQTPHLDELARKGTRFEHAYSATPTCVPARVALFTGQSQERHGRVGYQEGVPFDVAHPVTIQGEFRKAGYQTQAIGKMHVFPERSRIGFDDVILHDGFLHFARQQHRLNFRFFDDYVPWLRRQPGVNPDEEYFDHGVNCNSTVARPWDKAERLHPTSWAGSQAVNWLYRRDPTRPFFLYLSFHRPHPPYDPPAWAFEQYLDLPAFGRRLGNWEHHFDSVRTDGLHQAAFGTLPEAVTHRARAGYYGLMAHVDLQIMRMQEALSDFGLTDDTVIAFTSDHGEMMGDHDFYRKAVGYEGSARIPFIIAPAPSDAKAARQIVVDQVVELRDVMPTLLDLAGIPVPPECDGKSLVPLLHGEAGVPVRDWLHGEHVYFGQSLQWVTDGHVKYLWASGWGTEELFDLDADPGELDNLADDSAHAELLALWKSRLIRDLNGREEGFIEDGRLVAGKAVTSILRHTRERLAGAEAHLPG